MRSKIELTNPEVFVSAAQYAADPCTAMMADSYWGEVDEAVGTNRMALARQHARRARELRHCILVAT